MIVIVTVSPSGACWHCVYQDAPPLLLAVTTLPPQSLSVVENTPLLSLQAAVRVAPAGKLVTVT